MNRVLFLLVLFFPTLTFAKDPHVVVGKKAAFFSSATAKQRLFSNHGERYLSFRFVEKKGTRFHIKTTAPRLNTLACYDGFMFGSILELHFWVESADVMSVTTTVHVERFPNRTSIRLGPGIVLLPGKSVGNWRVDSEIRATVRYGKAGKVFSPTPHAHRARSPDHVATNVRIGKQVFPRAELTLVDQQFDKGKLLAMADNGCFRATALVDTLTVKQPAPFVKSPSMVKRLKKKSVLYWPNQSRAGRSILSLDLPATALTKVRDGRQCFDVRGRNDPTVELCVEPSALEDLPIKKPVRTVAGKTVASFPKDVIRGVVREHSKHLKFCYERQLRFERSLAGKVVVKFVIGQTGNVVSAAIKSNTLNNAKVETCILTVAKRLSFPEPEGGGIVIVGYPFTFAPSK